MGRSLDHKLLVPPKMTLNITSMADMFTILLVFLLMNYSLSSYQIRPPEKIELPLSTSLETTEKALTLSFSEMGLEHEGKIIVPIEQIYRSPQIIPQYLENGGIIKSSKGDESTQQRAKEMSVILLSHKKHSYAQLKPVLQGLANSGIKKIKFAAIGAN